MTLHTVAKAAGVSPSTVSRVINHHPRVAPETAKIVNAAIERLDFKPALRGRRVGRQTNETVTSSERRFSIIMLIIGHGGTELSPGFEGLMRGVSSAANDLGVDLAVKFCADPRRIDLPDNGAFPDGLLVHGEIPAVEAQARLQHIPCVWLMANRERPSWGDSVLPDNTSIGEIAADYLVGRGHRQVAICNVDWLSWSMEVRSHAFHRAAEARGAEVIVIDPMTAGRSDMAKYNAAEVAEQLAALSHQPLGLFVAEDRQVMPLYLELRNRGLSAGPDGDVDIISCNNQRAHLVGLDPVPATIDIRIETIGYRGLELLLARLRSQTHRERVRTLVDPALVSPPNALAAGPVDRV